MASQIYNRFDPAKHYDAHRFVPGRGLQSAELNEIQSKAAYDLRGIADVIFKDGDIVRDAQISVDPETGLVQCQSGAVYLAGAVRGVPSATLTIPVIGAVQVGIRLITDIVTSDDDPELLDPATGTRNYNQPGADRTRVTPTWAVGTEQNVGDFFPVYAVQDGTVQPKDVPPNLDGVTQAIARYDRDSSGGSYIVNGMNVTALADADATTQVYSIGQGRARVFGFAVEFPTSVRTSLNAVPDLKAIFNEPHLSSGTAAQRILFDRTPGTAITEVTIQARKTVTLTRGPTSGGQDSLPDNSVLLIVSVVQGGTTYVQGTDYLLTAGRVNWSPAGSEPATGSTYQVTYEYLTNVTPTLVDDEGFTVTGAVAGSLVQVSYSQKLPRIDALGLTAEGVPVWIKGVAAEYNPQSPTVPADVLQIASVYQTWTSSRAVRMDGVRLVSMPTLAAVDSRIDWLARLIAQNRLESSIHTREAGAKVGLFTDPFLDDSQRDAGTMQTAAIVQGQLMLPIAATVNQMGADVPAPVSLTYNLSTAIGQPLRTGSMKINPYLAFDRVPAGLSLTPAVDRWTQIQTEWTSPSTQAFVQGSGNAASTVTNTRDALLSTNVTQASTLRQIAVAYTISGFGPGEILDSLTFDGVSILPAGTTTANSQGIITGSFTIPSGIPSGSKLVAAVGRGGSRGEATFTGEGTIETRVFQRQTIVTTTHFNIDPLAQTFTMAGTTQVAGVDLWFADRPTTKTSVQIRETAVGFPTQSIVAEVILDPAAINVGGASTRVEFPAPVTLLGNVEYAVVVLCNDATGSLSVAELGKFDATNQQWITSQAYNVGVLLSSSNASSWTVHQERDLAFRILRADFTQTSRTVNLGSVAVTGATDLLLLGFADRPSSATGAAFRLTLPDNTVVDVANGQPLQLPAAITGQVAVSAVLTGTAAASPILYPGTQLLAGTVATSANYVTRAVPAGSNVRVKVIYEAQVPSGANVAASYKGPDAGDTWTAIANPATRPVDDGFVEFVHEVTGVNESSVQVQLSLSGTSAARPVVRDLRVIVL